MHRSTLRLFSSPIASLLLVAVGACASSAPASDSAPEPTEAATAAAESGGVSYFTAEQAEVGGDVWERTCSDCHDRIEFRGADFMFEWGGSSVGRLFRSVSRTMPDDDPGSLSEESYLAVVAYILQMNDFPAGDRPLMNDEALLSALRIER